MQNPVPNPFALADYTQITPTATIRTEAHGWRAKCLQRLTRLDLPVPQTVALPTHTVRAIAAGHQVDAATILGHFGSDALISVRPSPANPDWGGPGSVLNVGMNAQRHADLAKRHGQAAADALYLRFVQAYSTHVARLDPDLFDPSKPVAEVLPGFNHGSEHWVSGYDRVRPPTSSDLDEQPDKAIHNSAKMVFFMVPDRQSYY